MNNRTFVCIVCPNGCTMDAQYEDGTLLHITGHKCKRGVEYVEQEISNPQRTIATSVRIAGSRLPLCSVRLSKPIPKKDIFRVMEKINSLELTAPVSIGQVIIHKVCGLDCDVIVTKEMERVESN